MIGRRLVLVAVFATMAAACDARPGRAPLDLERMRDQPSYRPYDPSSFFHDGAAMRARPEGTVALEDDDLPEALARGTDGGRAVDRLPVAMTRALLDEGRRRFETFCAPCHGLDGRADTPVARRMTVRPPPSLVAGRVREVSDGEIFRAISEGYGLMPSYAYQLPPMARWPVVGYVRALQMSAAVPLDALPAPTRARAERALTSGGGR